MAVTEVKDINGEESGKGDDMILNIADLERQGSSKMNKMYRGMARYFTFSKNQFLTFVRILCQWSSWADNVSVHICRRISSYFGADFLTSTDSKPTSTSFWGSNSVLGVLLTSATLILQLLYLEKRFIPLLLRPWNDTIYVIPLSGHLMTKIISD